MENTGTRMEEDGDLKNRHALKFTSQDFCSVAFLAFGSGAGTGTTATLQLTTSQSHSHKHVGVDSGGVGEISESRLVRKEYTNLSRFL